MRTRSRSRTIVALVAAYAIALQALLLPLSTAVAAPWMASLCVATGPQEPANAPVKDHLVYPCAAGCAMGCSAHQAVAPPPQSAAALIEVYAGSNRQNATRAPAIRPPDHRPQIPRAPPVA